MDQKTQVLSYIKDKISSGIISYDDLNSLQEEKKTFSKNIINVLYVIGALIILVGVVVLFSMHWDELTIAMKLLVTLGVGLASYIAGITIKSNDFRILSQILFVVSAILANIGVFIMLDQADIDFSLITQFFVSVIFAGVYFFAYYINRRNILPLVIISFFTWAFYTLVLEVIDVGNTELLKYATMALGVSYGFIAYGLSKKLIGTSVEDTREKNSVSGILYLAGVSAFLGAGMTIGGYFDFIQVLLIFGLFYLSVYLKRKSILLASALFLIIHIIKISVEYFVDTAGWPLTLIVGGIVIIGVGVMTHKLNQEYVSR